MNQEQHGSARSGFVRMLNAIFVFMGVLFLIQIIAFSYIWFADPFGIRQFFGPTTGSIVNDSDLESGTNSGGSNSGAGGAIDANPLLSAEQEAQLKAIGVNPASLPSQITPEMEACFRTQLGDARTNEIAGGAEPTAVDYFKARSCL